MTSSNPVADDTRIPVRVRADIADLVPAFLDSRRREVAAIPDALQAADYSQIRSWAHNMAGTGSAFGFHFITEIGRAMEAASKAADAMTINACADKLAKYLNRIEVIHG
ncbi:MAG TPA: Hpt domain-containing protein [Planctomycetota bacterium]|jgi:HPt (histidine-containing phosphotransfer) domain-containing protein